MREYYINNNLGDKIDFYPKKKMFGFLFFSLLCYFIAIFIFINLSRIEIVGGVFSEDVFTLFFYKILGKWGVLILWIMVGNIPLYLGYKKYKLHKKYILSNKNFYLDTSNELLNAAKKYKDNYNIGEAIKTYDYIIQEFPGSEVSKKAKFHLKEIKKDI